MQKSVSFLSFPLVNNDSGVLLIVLCANNLFVASMPLDSPLDHNYGETFSEDQGM